MHLYTHLFIWQIFEIIIIKVNTIKAEYILCKETLKKTIKDCTSHNCKFDAGTTESVMQYK